MNASDLKNLRVREGLSQDALAGLIGMSRKALGDMESGKSGIEARTELAIYQALDDQDRARPLSSSDTRMLMLRYQLRDLHIAHRHLHRGDDVTAMAAVALDALMKPSGIMMYAELNSFPGVLNTLLEMPEELEDFHDLGGPLDYNVKDGGAPEGIGTYQWWLQPALVLYKQVITRGDLIEWAATRERDVLTGAMLPLTQTLRSFYDVPEFVKTDLPQWMTRLAFEVINGQQLVGWY